MSTARVRVLFIGGWGRSGSTLLDRLLGHVPGVVSLGEVREIWLRGVVEDRPCGCDRAFSACPFWTEVGERGWGGWNQLDVHRAIELQNELDKPWMVPLLAMPGAAARVRPGTRSQVDTYRAILDTLYGAIAETAGPDTRALVDSTKIPSHAYLLRSVPRVDLRMLHLVRDSRGVAYSWRKLVQKKVSKGDPAYLPRYGVAGSAARWLVYNAETSAIARLGVPYAFMRYEDLIADPAGQTQRALALAGVVPAAEDLEFLDGREVELAPSHTVEGNPMRFTFGRRTLRVDDEWRAALPARDRIALTGLTLPGLIRYGYGVRGRNGTSVPTPSNLEQGAP
ncbi:MAG: sulfotransferase domain-containing protein [Actinomycetota bacterium]